MLKVFDAREVFPIGTWFRLARIGSKHKNSEKQTNIDVKKQTFYLLCKHKYFNSIMLISWANKKER